MLPDLLLINGQYQLKLDLPFIPGTEVAGVVRSAPGGSGYAVGDRVFGPVMLGGYAEQAAIPVGSVLRHHVLRPAPQGCSATR